MRFALNTLTTILTNFGSREVPSSSSDTTQVPNFSVHRNPRAGAGSRPARLHAAKSRARLHQHRATADGAPDSIDRRFRSAGIGTLHGAKPCGTKYQRAKVRCLAGRKPLRRCNTALVSQQVHPQPPGAFTVQLSFIVPGHPGLDDRDLPPFTAQDLFFKAMRKADEAFLRLQEEREERRREAENARRLEQENEARRRAAVAEYLRQVEEDSRRAQDAHRRAMQEEFARRQAEQLFEAREACRRAEQERQRQAEREAIERERRERERLERERHEQDRLERERRERECRERQSAQPDFATQLRVYEEKWATVRSDSDGAKPLTLNDIPWPWFGYVQGLDDITDRRVLEFVGHSLRKHMQGGGGLARTLRFEMLRWHSDKFDKRVLDRVVDNDREAVKNAAGRVTRILTDALNSC